MEFDDKQLKELVELAKHAPQAYVRIKALAVWNVACGRSQSEVSKFMRVSRLSISRWLNAYRAQGIGGFLIKEGRGRKQRGVREEVEHYLRQCPSRFGLKQTRWTLRAIAEKVPSLRGLTESGVYRALARMGYRYQRGRLRPRRANVAGPEEMGLLRRLTVQRKADGGTAAS